MCYTQLRALKERQSIEFPGDQSIGTINLKKCLVNDAGGNWLRNHISGSSGSLQMWAQVFTQVRLSNLQSDFANYLFSVWKPAKHKENNLR